MSLFNEEGLDAMWNDEIGSDIDKIDVDGEFADVSLAEFDYPNTDFFNEPAHGLQPASVGVDYAFPISACPTLDTLKLCAQIHRSPLSTQKSEPAGLNFKRLELSRWWIQHWITTLGLEDAQYHYQITLNYSKLSEFRTRQRTLGNMPALAEYKDLLPLAYLVDVEPLQCLVAGRIQQSQPESKLSHYYTPRVFYLRWMAYKMNKAISMYNQYQSAAGGVCESWQQLNYDLQHLYQLTMNAPVFGRIVIQGIIQQMQEHYWFWYGYYRQISSFRTNTLNKLITEFNLTYSQDSVSVRLVELWLN